MSPEASALPSRRAVSDQFGVLAPEGFRDVTRPTDGLVGREDLRQFFRGDVIPAYSFGIRERSAGMCPVHSTTLSTALWQ